MPHITLEYTDNTAKDLDFRQFFSELHLLLKERGGMDVKNCKSRAIRLDEFFLADGKSRFPAFMHLSIRIFAGRPPDLKRILSVLAKDLLLEYVSEPVPEITVEIIDIDREAYSKHP